MKDKVAKLPLRSGMSVRTALVYAGELAPAVEEIDYFDFIVPVQHLFGMDRPFRPRMKAIATLLGLID